jgi:hypothetical protein
LRHVAARGWAALALAVSAPAFACPVCGQGLDQGSGAFLFMTIIMSVLPLAAIGAVVTWLVLRLRAHERTQPRPEAAGPQRP